MSKKDKGRRGKTTKAFDFGSTGGPRDPSSDPSTSSVSPDPPTESLDRGETFFSPEVGHAPVFAPSVGAHEEEGGLGRYLDLGVLGVGGMGEVRRVHDPTLKRTVAMKTLHARLISNERILSRFIEEAQIGAQLQHPNIIPVHELGELPDGRPYFTMQEIKGTEFTQNIQAVHSASDGNRWRSAPNGATFRDLVQTFHQVCVTIAYAHSLGVIHRDLKPDNIMIGRYGDVLVVDWGLAKILGETSIDSTEPIWSDRSSDNVLATRMGSIAGTPAYMSPEQARGMTAQIGLASDIYNLGAILYEILSGMPPYDGPTVDDIIDKVRTSAPQPLQASQAEDGPEVVSVHQTLSSEDTPFSKLPTHLVSICERAMEREAGDRYESAEVLASEIRAWLDGVEKRDKALKEVETSALSMQQAQSQDLVAEEKWGEANSVTEQEGEATEATWRLRDEAKEAEASARHLRRRYVRQLEGALVHDPELEEAHKALAELRITQLVEASAIGDFRARDIHTQQLLAHLQFVSSTIKEQLEHQKELQLKDAVAGQRARRGSLVGRQEQRKVVAALLRSGDRLVTLVGTAGVGKTRLALELADQLRGDTSRVAFCDLTEASDKLGVARLIARSLGIRLRDTNPLLHLTETLGKEPTLLVLDNLEQVVDSIGPICQEWVTNLPELRILSTSRARLAVPAETILPLKPLTLLESVELFTRRGQAVDPRFELSEENRDLVCDLVQKLDGLPLAIELASARLNILSLTEIAERLGERFTLLRSRGREAKALEGALDWSWDLLEPWERAALSHVSIFHGGFNLKAAESVIDVSMWNDCPAIFDILGELFDDSLLQKNPTEDGTVRYGMLESIRAYATGKLEIPEAVGKGASGPGATRSAQHRHAAHFAPMGDPAYLSALDSFESASRWMELFQELDNLVAAIDYGTPDTAPRCCLAALKILGMKGPVSLGVDIATQVLSLPNLPRRLKLQLEIERSKCLRISGRMDEARAVVRDSISLLRESPKASTTERETVNTDVEDTPSPTAQPAVHQEEGSSEDVGEAAVASEAITLISESAVEITEEVELTILEGQRLIELGHAELLNPDGNLDTAIGHFTAALDIFQHHEDAAGVANAKAELGSAHLRRGAPDHALEYYLTALEIYETAGLSRGIGTTLNQLANVYLDQGDLQQAEVHYQRALLTHQTSGEKRLEAIVLGNLANLQENQGLYEKAIEQYQAALGLHRTIGDKRHEGMALGNLANVYLAQGQLEQAHELHSQALDLHLQIKDMPNTGLAHNNLGLICAARGQYEEGKEHFTKAITIHRRSEDSRNLALSLGNLADTLIECEQQDEAAQNLSEAIGLATSSYPFAAGVFQGSLGLLRAHQGSFDEAKRLFGAGEPLVKSRQPEYAKFLCKKGHALFLSHQHKAAKASLDEATAIVDKLNIKEDSELVQATAQLQALLDGAGTDVEPSASETLLDEHLTSDPDTLKPTITGTNIPTAVLEADRLLELGSADREQSNHADALKHIGEALEIYREHANRAGEGVALGRLGAVYENQSQFERAIEHLTQAIDIHKEVGAARAEAIDTANLGNVYAALGQYEHAIEYFTAAANIFQDTGGKRLAGIVTGNLGNVYFNLNMHERAIEHLRLAIGIHREVGDVSNEGNNLGNLGDVLFHMGRTDEADAALREAIELTDDRFPTAAGAFRGTLALLLAQAGALDEVDALLERGQEQVTTKPEEHAKFICKMGQVHLLLGRDKQAHASLEQARKLAVKLKVGPDSGLVVAITELKTMLDGDTPDGKSGSVEDIGVDPEALKTTITGTDIPTAVLEADKLLELGRTARDQVQHDKAVDHFEAALKIYKRCEHRAGEGRALGNLGNMSYAKGEHGQAIELFTTAIDIHREVGDRTTEGINLGNLGIVFHADGHHERAIECYTLAIDIHREVGDKHSEGINLGNLGSVIKAQGQHERAIECYTQAIDTHREIGDKRSEGIDLGNLAGVFVAQGEHERGVEHYTAAIKLQQGAGDKRSEGITLGNLGDALAKLGRQDEAQTAFEKAIPISDKAHPIAAGAFRASLALLLARSNKLKKAQKLLKKGEPQVVPHAEEHAKFLSRKGQVQFIAGKRKQALASLKQAEDIAAELKLGDDSEVSSAIAELKAILGDDGPGGGDDGDDGSGTGSIESQEELASVHADGLLVLGRIEGVQGNHDDALSRYEAALEIFRKKGDRQGEGRALGDLGVAFEHRGQHERAHELYTASLQIHREVGDRRAEGIVLGNLGNLSQAQGQYEGACEFYQAAIALHREVGNKGAEGIVLGNLGVAAARQGEVEQSIDSLKAAIKIHKEVGDLNNQANNLGNLGDSFFRLGRTDEAESAFRDAIAIGDHAASTTGGAYRGSLALLLAQRDHLDEARALLEEGEPQVSSYPQEWAKFLAKKAQVLLLAGEHKEAEASLRQAETIAKDLGVREESEVAIAIAELKEMLNGRISEGEAEELDPLKPTLTGTDIPTAVLEAEQLIELGHIERDQKHDEEAQRCYESALEIFRRHEHRQGEGAALGDLGNISYRQGRYEHAIGHYTTALELHREVGDRRYEAICLGNLGNTYLAQGEFERAIALYTDAIEISSGIGDKRMEGTAMINLGTLLVAQGQHERAVDLFTRSIQIQQETGDRTAQGVAVGNRGDALFKLDRLDEAEAAFREAIAIGDETYPMTAGAFRGSLALLLARQSQLEEAHTLLATGEPQVTGNPEEHAKFLSKKGQVCHLAGDVNGARAALEVAKTLAEKLKVSDESELRQSIRNLEAVVSSGSEDASAEERELALLEAGQVRELGRLELTQGNHDEAFRCFREAMDICQRHGDRTGEGQMKRMLGAVYKARGEYTHATKLYTEALQIAQEVGSRHDESKTLAILGMVLHAQGQHERAIEALTSAVEIARELGVNSSEGSHLGNLGKIHQTLGQNERAIELFTQAANIFHKIGDRRGEGIGIGNLATLLLRLKRMDEAESAFRKAIPIVEDAYPLAAGAYRGSLAELLARKGQIHEAQALLETGEPLVMSHIREHASFLCSKGHVCHITGDTEGAMAALEMAETLSAKLKLSHGAILAQSIADLQALLHDQVPDKDISDPDTLKPLITGTDLPTDVLEADGMLQLGQIERDQGHMDVALRIFKEALTIYREHGVSTQEARALGKIAATYDDLGMLEESVECYGKALKISTANNDTKNRALCLGNLGLVLQEQGHLDKAIDHYQRAIELHKVTGDDRNRAYALTGVGHVHTLTGSYDEAHTVYLKALRIYSEVGDTGGEASQQGNLAHLCRLQGDLPESIRYGRLAIESHEERRSMRSLCISLGNLGDTLSEMGRWDEAHKHLQRAVELSEEHYPVAGGFFQGSLCLVLAKQGKLQDERTLLDKSESMLVDYPELKGRFLCRRSQVEHLQGTPEAARLSLTRAKQIAEDLSVTEHSELAQEIADLEHLLDSGGPENGLSSEAQPSVSDAVDENALAPLITGTDVSTNTLEADGLVEQARVERQRSQPLEAYSLYQEALKIYRDCGSRTGEAKVLGDLGLIFSDRGEFDKAVEHNESAISIYEETNNDRMRGVVLSNLANVCLRMGNLKAAFTHSTEAIEIHKQIGNTRLEAISICNLGMIQALKGHFEEAAAQYDIGIKMFRDVGDKRNEAVFQGNMGLMFVRMGKLQKAIEQLEFAREAFHKIDDYGNEGIMWGNQGELLAIVGRVEEGQVSLRKAIELCEVPFPPAAGSFRVTLARIVAREGELKEAYRLLEDAEPLVKKIPEEMAKFHTKKAEVLFLDDKVDAAWDSFHRALEIKTELGVTELSDLATDLVKLKALLDGASAPEALSQQDEDALRPTITGTDIASVTMEADRLTELGCIERQEANFAEAHRYFVEALEIYREANYREGEAVGLGNLGNILTEQGKLDEAIELIEQAIAIEKSIDNERGQASSLSNLARIHVIQGDQARAIQILEKALAIHERLGNRRGECIVQVNIGEALRGLGRLDEAHDCFLDALKINREIGDASLHGIVTGNLGEVLGELGREKEAIETLQEAVNLCEEKWPQIASSFRGSLAVLLAKEGQIAEALSLIEVGHEQVQGAPDLHALLLVKKGHIQLLKRDHTAAQAHLDEARRIANELSITQAGELNQAIKVLAQSLATKDNDLQAPSDDALEACLVETRTILVEPGSD